MSNLLVETASGRGIASSPITTHLLVKCLLYRDKACMRNQLGFVKIVGVEISIALLTLVALVEAAVRMVFIAIINYYNLAILIANKCSLKAMPKIFMQVVKGLTMGLKSMLLAVNSLAKNLLSLSKPIFIDTYSDRLREECDYAIDTAEINAALTHFDIQDFSNKEYYDELGVSEDELFPTLTPSETAAYYVISDFKLCDIYDDYGKAGVMIFLSSKQDVTIEELKDKATLIAHLKQARASHGPNFRDFFEEFFSRAGFTGFNFGPAGDAPKENPYEVLEVDEKATDSEIKTAYRKLALTCHPDKTKGDAALEEKFKSVGAAYEILSDPEKRSYYDKYGLVS